MFVSMVGYIFVVKAVEWIGGNAAILVLTARWQIIRPSEEQKNQHGANMNRDHKILSNTGTWSSSNGETKEMGSCQCGSGGCGPHGSNTCCRWSEAIASIEANWERVNLHLSPHKQVGYSNVVIVCPILLVDQVALLDEIYQLVVIEFITKSQGLVVCPEIDHIFGLDFTSVQVLERFYCCCHHCCCWHQQCCRCSNLLLIWLDSISG